MRRARRIAVHIGLVERMLGGTPATVCPDMPADVKLISWYKDRERDCFVLIVESASFEEVKDGDVIPSWLPAYRRIEAKS